MRIATLVLALCVSLGIASTSFAAEKESKSAPGATSEKPADQTGSISGSIHAPEKEAPKGCIAELHQSGAAGGGESIFYLFADGSNAKQLKDLANKGGSATVAGVVTEKGYRVTGISNVVKSKQK